MFSNKRLKGYQIKGYQKIIHLKPVQIIVMGFFAIILLGTFLLTLPIATNSGEPTKVVDALFTASSAVCVTGLVVVNTLEHWNVFGQLVILMLIQIGGLGFMSIVTMILVLAGKKITLKERILIQESLNQQSLSGMVMLVRRVVMGTLILEGIGAIILAVRFSFDFGMSRGIYMGFFHSISAFCNAGFDVIGSSSLTPYVGDFTINIVLMSLIVVGGLGFTVWVDVLNAFKRRKNTGISYRNMIRRLSLHTKVVLTITPLLIFGGGLLILLFEYANPETIGPLTNHEKVLGSLMQSVTARTAGFNSISQSGMTYASKFLTILLMFIGGSPSGTAGGVKTATMGVLVIAVISVIKGNKTTSFYERNIPFEILQKALAIFFLSLGVLIMVTMLLSFTERGSAFHYEFMDLLFETTSALATTGVSTGITPHLSTAGKIIISATMFMGRVGPISIAVALTKKQGKIQSDIGFPDGRIIVG